MKIFFDSSAWVKRYIEEKGSQKVVEIGLNAQNVSLSILCIPEVISAFARLCREGKVTQEQFDQLQVVFLNDIKDVQLINITSEVVSSSVVLLQQYSLRTLDALHLACAIKDKPDLFVTADSRQEKAAKGLGLKTPDIFNIYFKAIL